MNKHDQTESCQCDLCVERATNYDAAVLCRGCSKLVAISLRWDASATETDAEIERQRTCADCAEKNSRRLLDQPHPLGFRLSVKVSMIFKIHLTHVRATPPKTYK